MPHALILLGFTYPIAKNTKIPSTNHFGHLQLFDTTLQNWAENSIIITLSRNPKMSFLPHFTSLLAKPMTNSFHSI